MGKILKSNDLASKEGCKKYNVSLINIFENIIKNRNENFSINQQGNPCGK